ncbi:MAG: NAD(P)-dependent oxidoreductase, partial [Candidatus Binatia bacterium]
IHCPLNAETKRMLAEKELSLIKPSAYLINAARGGIVDEDALFRVLKQKKIAGAALDVIENEPPPKDHPLFKLDNVILTPHLGALTFEASRRGEWGAAEEAIRVLEGKRPKNPVIEVS